MIANDVQAVLSYVGAGTTKQFPITFPTYQNSDVVVFVLDADGVQTDLVETTDYTLANIGLPTVNGQPSANGVLTLVDASQAWLDGDGDLIAGYTLYIRFDPNVDQSVSLTGFGRLAKVIERALDKIVMGVRSIRYDVSRALTLAGGSGSGELPPLAGEGNKLVAVKADETGFEYRYGSPPIGFEDGAVLVKNGDSDPSNDRQVTFDQFAFAGYSARYSEGFNTVNLRETLEQILDLQYTAPIVSLTASGSTTVREKGDPVASTTLAATVTKTSDNIARIQFFVGGAPIAGGDYNPPASTGSQVQNHVYSTPFSDDTTFRVDVTDDGASGGPSTVSSSRSFTFVYPYYFGSGATGLTAAQVAALTKDIRTSNANLNKVFTPSSGNVFYFAYPAAYGDLTSILDENGFETIGDWTKRVENITGLDASAQSYNIYEFNNPVVAGTTNYTFVR